jgi:hexosaminidase
MRFSHFAFISLMAANLLWLDGGARAVEAPPPPALIPCPAALEAGQGTFTLTAATVIVADAASQATATQLAGYLKPASGFALDIAAGSGTPRQAIVLVQDTDLTELGTDGYLLTVTPERIDLAAPTQAGLFHAVQSLRQLMPPAIFASQVVADIAWQIPCVRIKDTPRFAWRGLMLDTGHDFQPLPMLLRFIDLMAIHKFNTLHWHITDLGTWPLEINGYPKLIEPFTRGTRQMGHPKRGVKPGYYTQDEVRQVVRYAAERHITIVPEIDMPGHSTPALTAYPEFDCPVPHKTMEWDHWEYCVGNEKTYGFLEDVLTQVMDLFPSTFIHIGGDECPKDHWRKCPLCQAKKTAENLKTEEELQSYFTRRIEKILAAKGRRLIGWDEILDGGLPANATVMAWRPAARADVAAAKAGHDVVMAPTSHLYFDYPEATTPLAKVYAFEPVSKELTPEQGVHILGAQAQMWTDNHPTAVEIERLVYPRACALAEVVWSPVATRDFGRFTSRLTVHAQRLAALGIDLEKTDK